MTEQISALADGDYTQYTLDIINDLVDLDGSETVTYTVTGFPAGTTFGAGTENADGSLSLTVTEAQSLTVVLPDSVAQDVILTIVATSEDVDPDTNNTTTATSTTTLTLPVEQPEVIEGPTDVNVLSSDVTTAEDNAVALGLGLVEAIDSDEIISDVLISGIPRALA